MIDYVAIALTDIEGKIAADGKPIAFCLSDSIRRLDQAIFRKTLSDECVGNVLVVIGNNTFRELAGTKAMKILKNVPVLTSSPECLTDAWADEVITYWDDNECSRQQLRREATRHAIEKGYDKIISLGGTSVYAAFCKLYKRIYLSYVEHSVECTESKNVPYLAGDWDLGGNFDLKVPYQDGDYVFSVMTRKEVI